MLKPNPFKAYSSSKFHHSPSSPITHTEASAGHKLIDAHSALISVVDEPIIIGHPCIIALCLYNIYAPTNRFYIAPGPCMVHKVDTAESSNNRGRTRARVISVRIFAPPRIYQKICARIVVRLTRM